MSIRVWLIRLGMCVCVFCTQFVCWLRHVLIWSPHLCVASAFPPKFVETGCKSASRQSFYYWNMEFIVALFWYSNCTLNQCMTFYLVFSCCTLIRVHWAFLNISAYVRMQQSDWWIVSLRDMKIDCCIKHENHIYQQ